MKSPVGLKPLWAKCLKATACDDVRLSMSTALRLKPLRQQGPPKGSRSHPSGFTGTTSVWPIKHKLGALGSVPAIRATNTCLAGSNVSISMPGPSRNVSKASLLRTSFPEVGVPSFTHAFLIRVCKSSTVVCVRLLCHWPNERRAIGDAMSDISRSSQINTPQGLRRIDCCVME